jgi:hypothetical protein
MSGNLRDNELGKFRTALDGSVSIATTGGNPDGSMDVVDGLSGGGAYNSVSMPLANIAYEAMAGVVPLAGRKVILIEIKTNGIFWGTDNLVTISTGMSTVAGQQLSFAADPNGNFQIFLVSSSINGSFRIAEMP